jgi:hypothetical protein
MHDTVSLYDSARTIMAAHPSSSGWHRVEAQRCKGKHTKLPVANDATVLWRRRRDYIDEMTFALLDPGDDPPIWVAESVGIALCINPVWVLNQRTIGQAEIVKRDLGNPWTVSDGPLVAGMTVTLTTSNGQWIYVVDGDQSDCCGGYTARWAD